MGLPVYFSMVAWRGLRRDDRLGMPGWPCLAFRQNLSVNAGRENPSARRSFRDNLPKGLRQTPTSVICRAAGARCPGKFARGAPFCLDPSRPDSGAARPQGPTANPRGGSTGPQ